MLVHVFFLDARLLTGGDAASHVLGRWAIGGGKIRPNSRIEQIVIYLIW